MGVRCSNNRLSEWKIWSRKKFWGGFFFIAGYACFPLSRALSHSFRHRFHFSLKNVLFIISTFVFFWIHFFHSRQLFGWFDFWLKCSLWTFDISIFSACISIAGSLFFVLLFLSCFITKSTKYTIFGIYLSILVYEAYIKISLLAAFFDSRIFSWKIQCCNFNMKNCWPSKNCKRLHNQIPTIRRRKKWPLNASFFRFAAANIIACIFICYRSIFHSYN